MRTIPFVGQAFGGVLLDWPRVFVNATVLTPDGIGRPFHIFNVASGQIERSFGGEDSGRFSPRDAGLMFAHVARGNDGGVWTLMRARFRLEHWSTEGELVERFTVDEDWFPTGGRAALGTRQIRPDPQNVGLALLEGGRLLVFLQVPSADWRSAWRQVPSDPHGPGAGGLPDLTALRDSRVALIDVKAGRIERVWPSDVFPVGISHGAGAMVEMEGEDTLHSTLVLRTFSVQDSTRIYRPLPRLSKRRNP